MNQNILSTIANKSVNASYIPIPDSNLIPIDYSANSSITANISYNPSLSFSTSKLSDHEKIKENKRISEFDIFKTKFENFLRFEDIPIEYTSPIEKEFIRFLQIDNTQTLNMVGQWIIDSYGNPKILLNIVKILGNVAKEYLNGQLISTLYMMLNHKDTELNEYILRIQEKILDDTFHIYLKDSHLAPKWIDDYRIELVELYLEEKGVKE